MKTVTFLECELKTGRPTLIIKPIKVITGNDKQLIVEDKGEFKIISKDDLNVVKKIDVSDRFIWFFGYFTTVEKATIEAVKLLDRIKAELPEEVKQLKSVK